MNKLLYFLAGAATAVLARPYVGPAFQKGVQYALKSFEEAQRELERSEAAKSAAAAGAGGNVSPLHPTAAGAEPERRATVSVVGANA